MIPAMQKESYTEVLYETSCTLTLKMNLLNYQELTDHHLLWKIGSEFT